MFISVEINFVNELRQGAAAGCALYALRGRAGGWHRQAMVGLHNHLRGAQLGCVVNRFVLYYANVKKGYRENGECIRTT